MATYPLKDFHLLSVDFLKLIASKRKNYPSEADFLEGFYDSMLALSTASDMEIHTLRLRCGLNHLQAKLLESELKATYNHYFQHSPVHAIEVIATSHLPTKKELEQNVIVK